jgi:D-serine deaminase-like pyridoxal phosphate-dependent protein
MFMDLVMAGLGVCKFEDIAISVLASIIGHQKEKGRVITDSGWMSLSGDRGTASHKIDHGFGLVCDLQGNPLKDYIVIATSQEHGIISHRQKKNINWEHFPIGSMIRILPNHACATAAMFDRYQVIEDSQEEAVSWPRINGW